MCFRSYSIIQHHTGWSRPIRCLKLQIIFRKRATNYRARLRKMTYRDKASRDSSPPYMSLYHSMAEFLQRYVCHHFELLLEDGGFNTDTDMYVPSAAVWFVCVVTAIHCNTLQHTATHCNTRQHTATHCNTLQHANCSILQHTAARHC